MIRIIFFFILSNSVCCFSQNTCLGNVSSNHSIKQNIGFSDSIHESSKSNKGTINPKKLVQYPLTISKKGGEEQVVHDEDYLLKEIARINYQSN